MYPARFSKDTLHKMFHSKKKKVWGFLILLKLIATSDLGNSDDTPTKLKLKKKFCIRFNYNLN